MGCQLAFGGWLAVGRLAGGLSVGQGLASPWLQAKFHPKCKRYRREVPQQVKKISRESVRRGRKHCKNHQNLPIWRSAAVPLGTLKRGRLWSNFIEKTIIIAEKSFKNAGGVSLVKFHLKTKGFSREVLQKVEKTSRESVGREREHCKLQLILKNWNSSADSPDSPEVVSWTAARDPPATRAGGQDDVSS